MNGTRHRSIRFFATKKDLIEILTPVEREYSISYVKTGMFDNKECIRYYSITDAEEIGYTNSGFWLSAGSSYMILPQKQKVHIREVPQRRGGIKYLIDIQGNENGLVFGGIGGIYTKMPKTLIGGRFFIMGYPDFDEEAMELYKTICKHFRRNCKRVEGVSVAKDALSLLKSGWRLTINTETPDFRYNDTMLPEQREEDIKNNPEVYKRLEELANSLR